MFNHTPEPWKIIPTGITSFETEIVTDSHVIAEAKHYSDEEGEFTRGKRVDVFQQEGYANAVRIVQCVNALAGIEDVRAFVEEAKRLKEAQNG